MSHDTTMWTASGRQIDLIEVLPTDIELWDIAASLSMQARFLGHTAGARRRWKSHLPFYSVAQHSLQVSLRCPEEYRLEGLLHDAAEAYMGDITRPMKALLERVAPGALKQIERQIEQAIALRFNLEYPWPEAVHTADDLCCRIEKANFWPTMGRGDETGQPVLPAVQLQCLMPGEAASFFVRVFGELSQKRNRS
jgi:hypothetical protein